MFPAWQFLLLTGFTLFFAGSHASALDLSRLDTAEIELESLVADWQLQWKKEATPATARELAASLQVLGMVERQAGKPAEAWDHLNAACDLFRTHSPSQLTDAEEALALTLQDLGQQVDAENLLRQVLAVREKSPAGMQLAATRDHLAMNLLFQGRYPEVLPLLDQAEAATPAALVDFRARLIGHRGRLAHTLGSHARASILFEQALALPFQDPELRLSLRSQLALSHLRLGKTAQSRTETDAIADDARKLFSHNRLAAVPYLNNLGAVAMAQGDLEIARSTFSEVLKILDSTLGSDQPGLIGPLNNLGVSEQEIGDYPAARSHLEQAAALQAKFLPPTHLRVAETERNLARNSLLAGDPDAKDHIIRATDIGLDLLDRLILDGSENERLNFLAHLDLTSLPCATGDPEIIANVLIASKARLLDAMLSNSAPTDRKNWQNVQAALSPESAFVDTCRFTTTETPPRRRYGAIIILPTGPPRWVPLGSDESLENWLSAFHNRLRWNSAKLAGDPGPPPPLKIRAILRALEREFWEPLQLPSEIRHVAFSPESRLHFLPLSALLDSENHPLADRFLQVTTVTSGRDLLNTASGIALSEHPWTVLNVSEFPKSKISPDHTPLIRLLSSLGPMPGTRVESDKIRSLAPAASTFLRDRDATESALEQLSQPPAVLHLGCHAFFLQQPEPPPGLPVDFDEHSDLLFAGGLVLYQGAQRQADSPRLSSEDDLLFPQEIASLPLHGTRLVTMSSCESGIGTPVSGEGLLGLRRAFSLAGAREVVVALWPVSDQSTPDFMQRFYQLALASNRPAQALWQTQAEFLNADLDESAFETAVLRYAPFVLSQNTPLEMGPNISQPKLTSRPSWIPILACLPLLLFLISRVISKKPTA